MDTYITTIEETAVDNSTSTLSNSTATKNTTNSTTANKTSIFDTYAVYFNSQSFKVSIIVVGYVIGILGWMLLLLISACIYRHAFERYCSPADFWARKETTKMKSLREKEEEELMK